jgi:hypothetical protein
MCICLHISSLKLFISYDKTFNNKFKTDAVNAIRRVVAQASGLFKIKSLPTKIDLNITQTRPLINLSWRAEDDP